MSGFAAAALRAAILKTVADDVEAVLAPGKDAVRDEMVDAGVEKIGATLPDGTKVASLSLCGGESAPRVTDPAAFQAWVEANRPGEIVSSVRESYVKAVLDEAKKAGRAVDRASGEVIPGITFGPTTPYVRLTFTRGDLDGRELIRRAHRRGDLNMLDSVLALPAGDGGES